MAKVEVMPEDRLKLPIELLHEVVRQAAALPKTPHAIFTPRQSRRHNAHYTLLNSLILVSRRWYSIARAEQLALVDIRKAKTIDQLLNAIKLFEKHAKTFSTGSWAKRLRLLRLSFPTCSCDFNRTLLPSPAHIDKLIKEGGKELEVVSVRTSRLIFRPLNIASAQLHIFHGSRFFEQEDRATDDETDMLVRPPHFDESLADLVQSALGGFEECGEIRELQLCFQVPNPIYYWPRVKQLLGRHERHLGMRDFVESAFPFLLKLSLENVADGHHAALQPPQGLEHLRLINSGPGAITRLSPSSAEKAQLLTLDIQETPSLGAAMVYRMVETHAETLTSFTLFTAGKGSALLHLALAPPHAPLFTGIHLIGDACAALLCRTIRNLTLGGPRCVSAKLFDALATAPTLKSLTLRGCGRLEGAPEEEEHIAEEREGVTSAGVTSWMTVATTPKLEGLRLVAMGDEWIWRLDEQADFTRAREHRHALLNPLTKEEKDALVERMAEGGSALHRMCSTKRVTLAFAERWED